MLKKTDESSRGLQAAAADSAAAASKAARATEPESAEAVVAASQLELAAYTSGVLSYLAEGRDFEALDLSQHVSLPTFPFFPGIRGWKLCAQHDAKLLRSTSVAVYWHQICNQSHA